MRKFLVKMECLLNFFKVSSTNLFFILSFSFIVPWALSSCKKNNEFGLEISPESQSLSNYSDTLSLNTVTIFADSIRTDELNGSSPLGNSIDPVFGEVNSSIYTQIRLEQSYNFIPTGGSIDSLVVDSVILYLTVNGFYGDINEQVFSVTQLSEDIYKDSNYYSNSSISNNSDELSSGISIKTNPLMPGTFSGELVDEAILRIPLDISNFALPIMNESGNSTLDGNDGDGEFISFFKGIKISTNSGNNGGLYYIDMLNSYTRIRLFYRDTSGTSADHDTLDFDFNINANCAYFHSVNHDYSGTIINEATTQTETGQNQFYLQALGGVNGIITIPGLNDLLNEQVIINKAEIIFPCENYSFDNFSPSSNLFLTRKNTVNEDEFLPDFFEGKMGGEYNSSDKNYTFNITRHINEIMADEIDNDTLKIFPAGGGVTANRTILNGINSSKKDKAKAIITYTKY